jgi:hypothetical protein
MSDTDLMTRIIERRQQLDQDYFNDLRELRQQHGDRAVDQALHLMQEQRDAVSAAPKQDGRQQRRGPQHFRIEKIKRLTSE